MKNFVILGATSAIAESTAIELGLKYPNATLHLFARNKDRLQLVSQNIKNRTNVSTIEYIYDLSDITLHQKLVSHFQNLKIDLCFLAYGILGDQKQAEKDFTQALEIINSNFTSAASLLSHFANIMEKEAHGTIAVISSVAGDRGRQSNYFYGSSKGALSISLSGLRNRLSKKNVHVMTIKPGFVDTPMTKDFKKGLLFVKPQKIAKDIVCGIEKQKNVIYTPFFWRYIMLIIIHIPERIFKNLSL